MLCALCRFGVSYSSSCSIDLASLLAQLDYTSNGPRFYDPFIMQVCSADGFDDAAVYFASQRSYTSHAKSCLEALLRHCGLCQASLVSSWFLLCRVMLQDSGLLYPIPIKLLNKPEQYSSDSALPVRTLLPDEQTAKLGGTQQSSSSTRA